MDRLSNRVALVTGAANGIGEATAYRLAAEGAAVVVTDIDDERGRAVVAALAANGARAAYLHHDVASETDWQHAVEATVERFGALDVLVNNAGVHGERESIEDVTLAAWERSIAILQTGVFLGMRCATPALRASPHASVVNISSIFGASGGFGGSPAYHAAKGAVRVLTKNAAVHWARDGIRVNSIHPGFIDTGLLGSASTEQGGASAGMQQVMLDVTPMARLGRPEEVAAGVAYLAGDDAAFVTGSELYIDGGFSAR
ncbi:SDR family NAD(P)-dependent oxidoreductase [Trujillonella endophytica]|uniref:NAD(P)-dependent dehydrogenase, short-chain alcohol dehydrogenase family n=1 Tax=Trujillonella endophytica TaxID=673521 RepID=A0A1H8UQW9_9ACTN|nr:glucose 1-dehydrogenase [Trujillella endophytica]SEP05403.1 NAD(P)-dependent dehydrogenase, short-chain alcohol dehydrogenase family [Trujillella endophytica]